MRLLALPVALAAVALAPAASAQLLVEENFDYNIGTALTATGNYTAHSAAGSRPISVTDNNLTFPDYPSVTGNATTVVNGGSGEDVNRSFTEQTSGTLYAAFLVRSDAASSGQYFFHLGPDPIGTTFRARVFAQSTTGGVQYGISTTGGSADAYSSDVFALGETALLVVRYDVDTGQPTLYTFGSTESYGTEPASADAAGATGSSISPGTFALRQTSGSHTIVVDGVRIGTSYADVIPAETPEFTFDQPVSGDVFRVGGYLKPIWQSPDPAPANVEVTLLKGGEAEVILYQGENLERPDFGAARYLIPNGTPADDDYQIRVADAADPSVSTDSDLFTISDPRAAFAFSEPDRNERYAIGATVPLAWTSPAGAPGDADGGTVTISLIPRNGGATIDSETTSNDGAYNFTIPESVGEGFFRFSIVSDQNANYTGTSPKFRTRTVAVTAPDAGDVFAAGGTLDITWEAPTASASTAADLFLKAPGEPRRLIAFETENDGSVSYTIPDDVAPGDQYFIALRLRDGETFVGVTKSPRFEITNDAGTDRQATPHFGEPVAYGTRVAWLTLDAPGLPDGAEVAAFADGDLVGSGVVVGGQSSFSVVGSLLAVRPLVPGAYADDDFVALADGAPLALRAFADGLETALPTAAPRVDGAPVDGLAFVDGAELAASVAAAAAVPGGPALGPAYPNPTRDEATVRFTTPSEGPVTVEVFDALGRRVATLLDAPVEAGPQDVRWDTSRAPAGVYVVRLATPAGTRSTRVTVLR